MIEVRNGAYDADGAITGEIQIDGTWLPFTARDGDATTQDAWDAFQAQSIAAYSAPALTEADIREDMRARIRAVADENARQAMIGAAVAGALDASETALFQSAQGWIAAMMVERDAAIAADRAPSWPDIPAGVEAFAAVFAI